LRWRRHDCPFAGWRATVAERMSAGNLTAMTGYDVATSSRSNRRSR
jgi:hypothetical protein